MRPENSDNVNVHFILGPGRSGTALLMWILNTHPECIALPEIKHVTHFYQKYKDVETVTLELITDMTAYFSKKIANKNLMIFAFNYQAFFEDLKIGQKISYDQLCRKIYMNYSSFLFPDKKIRVAIDKNPLYSMRVDDLAPLFKEAKFLFMIRDYRAYVLSTYENLGNRGKLVSAHLYSFFWLNHMRLINRNQKKRGERCMVLRYEDFTTNAPLSVKEVCDFFGLSYSDEMLEYYKVFEKNLALLETIVHPRRIKKIRQLSKPINPARLSSWQKGLSIRQVKRIEFWCSKTALQFNYSPTVSINFLEKVQYFIEGFPLYLVVRGHFFLASLGFFKEQKKRS